MTVTVHKDPIYPDEPDIGSLTDVVLNYDPMELIEIQQGLIEEGQTEDETNNHEFEVDGYTFRLGDYI